MRLRLAFEDGLVDETLTKSWTLVPSSAKTIGDLAYFILESFHLMKTCNRGLTLLLDSFALPPSQTLDLIQTTDVVEVRRRVVKRKREDVEDLAGTFYFCLCSLPETKKRKTKEGGEKKKGAEQATTAHSASLKAKKTRPVTPSKEKATPMKRKEKKSKEPSKRDVEVEEKAKSKTKKPTRAKSKETLSQTASPSKTKGKGKETPSGKNEVKQKNKPKDKETQEKEKAKEKEKEKEKKKENQKAKEKTKEREEGSKSQATTKSTPALVSPPAPQQSKAPPVPTQPTRSNAPPSIPPTSSHRPGHQLFAEEEQAEGDQEQGSGAEEGLNKVSLIRTAVYLRTAPRATQESWSNSGWRRGRPQLQPKKKRRRRKPKSLLYAGEREEVEPQENLTGEGGRREEEGGVLSGGEDLPFEQLPKLDRELKEGDVIAYKIFEPGPNWCPGLSDWKKACVIEVDGSNITLEILNRSPEDEEEEEADLNAFFRNLRREECEKDLEVVAFEDMIDTRLFPAL